MYLKNFKWFNPLSLRSWDVSLKKIATWSANSCWESGFGLLVFFETASLWCGSHFGAILASLPLGRSNMAMAIVAVPEPQLRCLVCGRILTQKSQVHPCQWERRSMLVLKEWKLSCRQCCQEKLVLASEAIWHFHRAEWSLVSLIRWGGCSFAIRRVHPSWPLQPRTGGIRKTLWREPVLWKTPDCVHYLHTASDGLAPMSLWWCDIPGRWATVWILDREHGPRSSSWEWIRLEQLVCDGWWTFCLAFAAELH